MVDLDLSKLRNAAPRTANIGRVLALTHYDLRRIARNRAVCLTLALLPALGALLRIAFAGSGWSLVVAWIWLPICLAFAAAWILAMNLWDRASSFLKGLKSTPLQGSGVVFSRLLTGATLFLVEAVVFCSILAIRF